MATEFYLFSAFVAQGGTDADLPSLEVEVLAVGGGLASKFEYSEKTPGGAPTGVTFTFTVALTAPEKTSLDGVVAAHLGTPTIAPDPIIENTPPVDGQLVVYDSGASPQAGYVNRTVSGDVTIDVTGAVTLQPDSVTYDKIQDVVANNVFLGNDDGAGSTVQELTGTEATVLLDVFTAALKGLAPASGGGTTNFLRADGTWAAPAGATDELVKITATDTTSGFLDAKLIPGAGLTRTILNPAADEDYEMNVVANADGSIVVNANDVQVGVLATDAQHGTRGGGTLHAAAVAGVSAGFISAADQTKVDNLSGTNTGDVTLAGALNYITIAGQVITRNAIDLTTDVTGQLPTANIADDAVTYAKIQNVVANNVLLGNDSGAGSIVQELTGAEVNLFLPVFTAALNGLVPLSGGGTTNFLRADGTWTAPGGGGDVVGPASATDNAIVRFDTTTGKLIQDSGVTISDTNEVDGIRLIDLDVLTGGGKPAHLEGRVFFDGDDHTLAQYLDETDITQQLGQEFYVRVFNNSGATITNGQIVYVSGSEGTEFRPTIALARADTEPTSEVIGWATHDIENNTFGYITSMGLVNDVDTSGLAAGNTLYLDETTAGAFRTTPPPTGFQVLVGYVIRVDAVNGRVLVSIIADLGLQVGDANELVLSVIKDTVGTINPGQVVRLVGYNLGQDRASVELAQANSAATMPAIGIARDTITNSSSGNVVIAGRLLNQNTAAFAVTDEVWVDDAVAGALTNVKPDGTALIQKMAQVLRSNASNGAYEVFGAGRVNDLPNIPQNNVWIGDVNGVPQASNSAALTAILDQFTAGLQGVVPGSGGGTTNFLRADGTWAPPGGGGDVVGPASATDNALVRFDTTTGKLIQNSNATLSDAGRLDLVSTSNASILRLFAEPAGQTLPIMAVFDNDSAQAFSLAVFDNAVQLQAEGTAASERNFDIRLRTGGNANEGDFQVRPNVGNPYLILDGVTGQTIFSNTNISPGTADVDIAFEIRSTDLAFLPPRLSTTARNALVSPPAGAQIYNSTDNVMQHFDGTVWVDEAGGTPRGAGAGLVLNVNDLDVVANADGSIVVNPNDVQVGVLATDAQHGTRGGGTLHAIAVPAGAAGFMSGADKTKVDNLSGTNTGDVTLAGVPNYITIAGQVITRALVNLQTHITGTLLAANLGTNAVTTVKILDANVTNAKLANMAQSTFKGRAAGTGTGVPIDLSATQATAILNNFTSALKGLAPASGGGTTNFLRADGTWAAPTAGSGDVTGPASSADNQVVRFDGATGKVIQGLTAGVFSYSDTGQVTIEVGVAGHALFITNTTASGEFIRMVNAISNGAIELNAGTNAGVIRALDGTASEIPRFVVDANTGVLVDFSAAGVALPTDFRFTVQGSATGDGMQIMAGEVLGDIAFHVADQDNSFTLMEIEADQGFVTFGETYAQTLIDNGVVYGVDNQNTGNPGDFNAQAGQYRIAGTPIPLKVYDFYADQVEYPTGTNWNVNVGAPASADSNNAALTVRLFDDTVDEAIGFIVNVPEQATEMVVTTIARRESGVTLQNAIMVLHSRSIGDAAAVGAWTTDALTTVALPANENFVYDETDQTLATWGLTAGTVYQMQLSRDANAGGDTLVGDLALLAVRVEFR